VKIRYDNKIAVTGGWDYRLRVFDWNKPRPLAILKGHTAEVYALDLAPTGNMIASGSKDKRIALWSIY
jgi:WD40 repeat protein